VGPSKPERAAFREAEFYRMAAAFVWILMLDIWNYGNIYRWQLLL